MCNVTFSIQDGRNPIMAAGIPIHQTKKCAHLYAQILTREL